MSIDPEYIVHVEVFAERHYIKNFRKKYQKAWDVAWKAQLILFKKFSRLFETNIAETIRQHGQYRLCKTGFRIHGKESRKTSGNRCIVVLDDERKTARVLLVYNKSDLKGSGNETAKWQQIIKQNFPEFRLLVE